MNPVLLFRFSALTYNAHRIHYDRDYARAEGYPGLLVHGPLQALLMAELARREADCRPGATTPTAWSRPCSTGRASSCPPRADADAVRVTARDAAGRTTATGVIRPAGS